MKNEKLCERMSSGIRGKSVSEHALNQCDNGLRFKAKIVLIVNGKEYKETITSDPIIMMMKPTRAKSKREGFGEDWKAPESTAGVVVKKRKRDEEDQVFVNLMKSISSKNEIIASTEKQNVELRNEVQKLKTQLEQGKKKRKKLKKANKEKEERVKNVEQMYNLMEIEFQLLKKRLGIKTTSKTPPYMNGGTWKDLAKEDGVKPRGPK